MNNDDTHPPQLEKHLSVRYFFDISELLAHGQDVGAVKVEVYYDESAILYGKATRVSAPIAWDAAAGVYYVEIDWGDAPISGKRELQFGLCSSDQVHDPRTSEQAVRAAGPRPTTLRKRSRVVPTTRRPTRT